MRVSSTGSAEPVVDVGIPAWGRPRYVVEAIESILSQTFERWRLHVSEDGPGGGEVQAAVEPYLADTRISYSATGGSLGAPRNKTLLIQKGDSPFVGLLDDDDHWRPDFLRRRVEFLEAHRECGFVFSPIVVVDEQGRELERSAPLVAGGVHRSEEFVPRLLRRPGGLPGTTFVVRRSAYEAVGQEFDVDLPRTYDYEMWLRLAVRFPVGYLTVWDAAWRRHPARSSADVNGLEEEYSRLVGRMSALIATEQPRAQLSRRGWRWKRAGWLLSAALDALDVGDRAGALSCLARALQTSPRALADPRVPAVLAAFLLGEPGRRAVVGLRAAAHRKRAHRTAGNE